MKRLLFVVVLMLCLSFPAFAGHTIPGDWCQCAVVSLAASVTPENRVAIRARAVCRMNPSGISLSKTHL